MGKHGSEVACSHCQTDVMSPRHATVTPYHTSMAHHKGQGGSGGKVSSSSLFACPPPSMCAEEWRVACLMLPLQLPAQMSQRDER